ncbi:hypothetical protein [Aliiroseovarius sp. 2305UL8-7]|uniref:hypothetical protein n=1 Tax=Aliiroseovarius conchicola TaxID=3121637 RepID=UPI003527266A
MISTEDRNNEAQTCAGQLDQAARMVQDVAYALASRVDNTTLTELMLVSRKLERLTERLNTDGLGDTKLGGGDPV